MTNAPAPDGWLLRFLRRGAMKHLNVALHDSKGALSGEWVERDPDLRAVRDAKELDWQIVWERNRGNGAKPLADPDWRAVQKRAKHLVGEMGNLHGHPERPWGDPARRHYAWSVLAIALALGVVVLVLVGVTDALLLNALAALAALAAARAGLLARETWRTWSADPQAAGDAAAWRRRSIVWRRIAFALGVGALIYVGVEPTEDIVWQLPFVLALLVMLAIGWAVIAASQAVRLAHAGKQFGFDQIAPTAR